MAFGQGGQTGALVGSAVGGAAGGPVGAAIGLGVDVIAGYFQNKEVRKAFKRFTRQQFEVLGIEQQVLAARTFEQQVNLANQADQIERASRLGMNLSRASAFASGVQGRTVEAISRTRLVQEDAVRAAVARQFRAIDSNYDRQSRALILQTKINIANAAQSAKGQMTSLMEVIGGVAGTVGALHQVGALDSKATAADLGPIE